MVRLQSLSHLLLPFIELLQLGTPVWLPSGWELIASAVKGVQEWVDKPCMLDGAPVDVETDIRVNFYVALDGR